MIKKIILALGIGCLLTVILLQDDPWLKQWVERTFIQAFQLSGNCRMTGTLQNLNLVWPHMEFNDVIISSCSDSEWHWAAEKFKISFSWLHVLCFGSVAVHVEIDTMHSDSRYKDNRLAIMEHILALFYAPSGFIPIVIKSLTFNNAHLNMYNDKACLQLQLDCTTKTHESLLKTHVNVRNGTFKHAATCWVDAVQGTLQIDSFGTQQDIDLLIQAHMIVELPQLPPLSRRCTISGIWNGDKGELACVKEDGTFRIDPIKICWKNSELSISGAGSIRAQDLYRLWAHKDPQHPLHGTVYGSLALQQKNEDSELHGTISMQDIDYGPTKICNHAQLQCVQKNQKIEGTLDLAYDEAKSMQGIWSWNMGDKKGVLNATNNYGIAIPGSTHWKIKPRAVTLHADMNDAAVSGFYVCQISNDDCNETAQVRGDFSSNGVDVSVQGNFQDVAYAMKARLDDALWIQQAHCYDKKGEQLFFVQEKNNCSKKWEGAISVSLLKALAQARWGYEIQGEGTINFQMTSQEDVLSAKLKLAQGTIRLPHTYNFMHEFMMECILDAKHQKISIPTMRGSLHRGSFSSSQATLFFDDMYDIKYAYVPLLLHSCLFNVDKDLFALVSGRVACIKHEDVAPLLKSNLIIEHAQLKENIFSQEFQKDLFKSTGSIFPLQDLAMQCDITLETMAPIHIKTALLETQAKITMHAKNSIMSPEISGSIDLKSGTISFPYKPLYITKGSLYFTPQNSTDPRIELTAKNNIKKHNISMMITGSVAYPHIMLESSPPLTEEQIIALLLVGSPEESLNIVMPALVMQNLTNLVFSKDQSPLNLDRYFKTFLKPFKQVHLVPSFTDQTGRGGLRGAIEVDINDRWRALLQKNFNLSEDTKFELEYLLSDDVSVKGFRDERRDVGAEVEMRWKF